MVGVSIGRHMAALYSARASPRPRLRLGLYEMADGESLPAFSDTTGLMIKSPTSMPLV
jgi:hypothetical protein